MGITAGITVASTAYQIYQKHQQDLIENAQKATAAWNDSQKSISDYKTRYSELKTSLDSGTLTSSEEYNTKMQILAIQQEITAQYGEQASGVDLVNGSLETQLGLLDSISAKNAKENLNEGRAGYKKAREKMTDEKEYTLGTINTSGMGMKAFSPLNDLMEKYGLKQDTTGGSGTTVQIKLKANATEANKTIQGFMSDVQDLQSNYAEGSKESDFLNGILDSSGTALSKNKKLLDDYGDNYKAWMEQDLYAKGKGKNVQDYAKAIDDYNEALAGGDSKKIQEARANYAGIKNDIASDKSMKNYADLFSGMDESLDTAVAKSSDFLEILSGKGVKGDKSNQFDSKRKDIEKYSDSLKKLKLDGTDVTRALTTKGTQTGEGLMTSLAKAFDVDLSDSSSIQSFIDLLTEAGVVAGQTADEVEDATNKMKSVEELTSMLETAKTNMSNINAAVSNSSSSQGMAVEDVSNVTSAYQELIDNQLLTDDAVMSVIEHTSSGLKINRDRLSALNQMQEQFTKNEFVKSMNEQVKALDEYKKANKDIAGTDEYNSAIEGYKNQIEQIRNMKSEYDGLTSAFNKWQTAQSNGEDGDRYSSVSGARTSEQTAYEKGKTGTEDFKTYVDYLWSGSTAASSAKEIAGVYEKLSGITSGWFVQADSEKNIDALDAEKMSVENFASSVQNDLTPALQEYADRSSLSSIDADTKKATLDVRDFADAWGVSADVVEDMAGLMKDYGWDVEITGVENNTSNLQEMGDAFTQAQQKLQGMNISAADSFNWDTLDIDSINSQIDTAMGMLDEFRNADGTINIEAEGAQETITILQTLIRKREELANNNNVLLDVSTDSGSVNALQGFMDKKNAYDTNYQLKVEAGVDVDVDGSQAEAQEAFEDVKSQIQSAFEGNEVSADLKAKFDLDNMSMDDLEKTIQDLTPDEQKEIALAMGVDTSELDEALRKKDELTGGAQTVNITATVNGKEDVQSLDSAVQALPANSTANLTMSVQNEADLESAVGTLESIPPDVSANVIIDVPEGKAAEVQAMIDDLNAARDADHQITATLNTTIGDKPDPVEVEGNMTTINSESGGVVEVDATANITNVTGADSQSVEIDGKVNFTADTSGVDMYKPTVNGKVRFTVDSSGVDMYKPTIDAKANISEVTGADGETVNINATANVTDVAGEGGRTVDINATAKISDVTGEGGQQVIVPAVAQIQSTTGTDGQQVNVNATATVTGIIDNTGTDGLDKTATVTFQKNSGEVDSYNPPDKHPSVIYSLSAPPVPNYPNISREIVYSIRTNGIIPRFQEGTAHSDGTISPSLSNGIAFARGVVNNTIPKNVFSNEKYRTVKDQMALTGELGRELVVTGDRWYTVGDKGAEFSHIPANSIIFNHLQTKQLLEKGFTNSRGKAHAGGTAIGGAAYASGTDFKEEVDYIEILIDRITKAFERLSDASQDFYTNYVQQNREIDKAISKGNANIGSFKSAYNSYMNLANSVQLSASEKKKIQNGALTARMVTDENLKEKIDQYKDWYESAQDVRDQIMELNNEMHELAMQKLDNIVDDFDAVTDYRNAIYDYNQSLIDLAEESGKTGSETQYNTLIKEQNAIRGYLNGEYKQLQAQFNTLVKNNTIKTGTDEWYEWQAKLIEIKQSITECDTEIQTLQNSILETRWDVFDKGITKLDTMKSTLSSLSGLIDTTMIMTRNSSAIDGELGLAGIGLLQGQLATGMQGIANFEKGIASLTEQYNKGLYSESEYTEKLDELRASQLEYVNDVKDAKDALLDYIRNGIEAEVDAMDELIDKRKEALRKQKEADEYQKDVEKQNKEINKIRGQIAALEGNDSKQAIAERKKLNDKLLELQDGLDETRKNHEQDMIEQSYDDMLEDFKETQQEQLDLLNSSLASQNTAISDMLNLATQNYDAVYKQLTTLAESYGITLSSSISDPWMNAINAINQYGQAMGNVSADSSADVNTDKISGSTNTTTNVSSGAENSNISSLGGVIKSDSKGSWYEYVDGSYAQNEWAQVGGKRYHFGKDGYAQKGWFKDKDGKWYYADSKGVMVKNKWKKSGKLWYHLGTSGAMDTSKWVGNYYVQKDGSMATNAYVKYSDHYSWVGADGKWQKQWDTKTPNLKKYKLAYQTGTKSAQKGYGTWDEEGLGTEFAIEKVGTIREYAGGEMIFNKDMKSTLWDFASDPAKYLANIVTPFDYSGIGNSSVSSGDVIIDCGNMLNVENLTGAELRDAEKFAEEVTKRVTTKLAKDFGKQGFKFRH